MRIREDIIKEYRFYHNILEGIFAKAFNESRYDYSILFGPILAQTIGRYFNQDVSLFKEYASHELTLGEKYSAHLVKYMAVPSKESIISNDVSLIRTIFSIFRWFIYFFIVVIKFKLFRCRCAVDICDSKPDTFRRISYLFLTKYIVPPTLTKAVRKIYFNISKLWLNEITELEFFNIYNNFINSIEGLNFENKIVLRNVFLGLASDEIIHFRANKALAQFLYRDFYFELQNCFYFDSAVAHAICEGIDLGCTFDVMQHGGGYGILDGNVYELFETEQFGENFHYLDAHEIKNGNKKTISKRWAHLPTVNSKNKNCKHAVLILSNKNIGLDSLMEKSDITVSVKFIIQIISLLRSIDEKAILDILPYDKKQVEELSCATLLNIPNVRIIDRSNKKKYKLYENAIFIFDNFGSLFYECLTRGLPAIVVNIYSLNSYQKDWEERVEVYIKDGHFVWNVKDLYGIAKLRLSV